MPSTLRIATRQSPLALWQAEHVRQMLLQRWPHLTVELLPMLTTGDAFLKDALLTIGGKGLFVKELEEALLDDRADIAVHSMKDVPANTPDGLCLATICKRDNPFDALVSTHYLDLNQLPLGARIGTTSLRRQSQLLAVRPDLQMVPLRGNIHTRIRALDANRLDAIILAAAGLERMGLHHNIQQVLPDDIMLPACGQGALGIECRTNDEATKQWIAPLHHAESALAVQSERQVNALLGGNCHVPIAVYCSWTASNAIHLRAKVASPDGKITLQQSQQGDPIEANALAERCAQTLLSQGASALLNA